MALPKGIDFLLAVGMRAIQRWVHLAYLTCSAYLLASGFLSLSLRLQWCLDGREPSIVGMRPPAHQLRRLIQQTPHTVNSGSKRILVARVKRRCLPYLLMTPISRKSTMPQCHNCHHDHGTGIIKQRWLHRREEALPSPAPSRTMPPLMATMFPRISS